MHPMPPLCTDLRLHKRCEGCLAVMWGVIVGTDKPARRKCHGCDPAGETINKEE